MNGDSRKLVCYKMTENWSKTLDQKLVQAISRTEQDIMVFSRSREYGNCLCDLSDTFYFHFTADNMR